MTHSLAASGLSLFAFSLAFGQANFEVASVKPANPDAHGSSFTFTPGGGLNVSNGTLKGLIQMAYDVRDFQISGGPNWLDSDRYNIDAKSTFGDQPAANSPERNQETRQKLQALLADRFHLKVHRDTRDLPVFFLVPGKNGAKLTRSASEQPRSGIRASCGQMTGTNATMAVLSNALSRELGRPVRDQTGLSAKYDFQIDWTPDEGPCATRGDASADTPPERPSIFTAIQMQLGLRLEPAKGPVEVIVVDQAEKAEGN